MSAGFNESSQQAQNSGNSSSGFSLLPQAIQQSFNQYAGDLNSSTSNVGNIMSAFQPGALNANSQGALTSLEGSAFSPTAGNIQSAISAQQNPFNQSVIDTINRQAQGSSSQLGQQVAAAGQFGSNRASLGANDIDTTRLQQIGNFEQSQYNTDLGNAINTILPGQAAAASGAVAAGQTQQNIGLQQSEAPYTALSAYSALLGGLPQSGGSVGSNQGTSSGSSFGMNASV